MIKDNLTSQIDFESLFNTFREHQFPYYADIGVFSFRAPRHHPHSISAGIQLIESTDRIHLKDRPSAYYYHFNKNINLQYFNQLSDRICLTTATPMQIEKAVNNTDEIKLFFFCDGFCCEQVCCSMNPVLLSLLFTFIAVLILIVISLFVVWRHKNQRKQFEYNSLKQGFDHELTRQEARVTSINHPKTAVACKTDSVFSKTSKVKTFLFGGGRQLLTDDVLLCEDEFDEDVMELQNDALIAEGVFV
uniref:CX domain-containing protein n=1 Tax=Parastrongyloides trichosuri TaxID=131310 RepID=A0A0N4ZP39_PARTI